MKYLISFLMLCSIVSCSKEESLSNGSVLVRVLSAGQLSNVVVSIHSDTSSGSITGVAREISCGADNLAYFTLLPPDWYHIRAQGNSSGSGRYLSADTLLQVRYRAGQNHYNIELLLK